MQDISLHILDIIENSVRAKADLIKIYIIIEKSKDTLEIKVWDNGCGMTEKELEMAQNPFYTTKAERKKKVGLGIPLFKQNAEQCDGYFNIKSQKDQGTSIKAVFKYSHYDRMPLGNLTDSFVNSIIGHPEVDFEIYLKRKDENMSYEFSTKIIKDELGDIPITYPDVIKFVNNELSNEIKK